MVLFFSNCYRTYIPSQLEIALTLTYGHLTIINETVSAKNPDICVDIPYLKKLASICLDFTNVTYSSAHLSGCVDVRAELVGITIYKAHIGCFNIHVLLSKLVHELEPIHAALVESAQRRKIRV